jgi:hypothetical protein
LIFLTVAFFIITLISENKTIHVAFSALPGSAAIAFADEADATPDVATPRGAPAAKDAAAFGANRTDDALEDAKIAHIAKTAMIICPFPPSVMVCKGRYQVTIIILQLSSNMPGAAFCRQQNVDRPQ